MFIVGPLYVLANFVARRIADFLSGSMLITPPLTPIVVTVHCHMLCRLLNVTVHR